MKTYIKTISWKFHDAEVDYPQLKDRKIKITSPQEVYDNFNFLFQGQVKKRFLVFWLSSSNVVTGFEVISEGLLNCSLVHPREVYRGAIVSTAANIILAHNHPSGNTEPSNEDISITKQLVEAGKIMGISVFDHIIFSDKGYTSFVDKRLL